MSRQLLVHQMTLSRVSAHCQPSRAVFSRADPGAGLHLVLSAMRVRPIGSCHQRPCTSSLFILRVALLGATAESGAHRALRAHVLSSAPLAAGDHRWRSACRAEIRRLVTAIGTWCASLSRAATHHDLINNCHVTNTFSQLHSNCRRLVCQLSPATKTCVVINCRRSRSQELLKIN